jgi:hypothetical protein
VPGHLLRTERGVDQRFTVSAVGSSTGAQAQGAGTRASLVRARLLVVMCCLDAELMTSTCSPSASSARAEPEGERASPATAAAITIAVAGIVPQAGETPPPATETPRQAVRMKRAIRKKSIL